MSAQFLSCLSISSIRNFLNIIMPHLDLDDTMQISFLQIMILANQFLQNIELRDQNLSELIENVQNRLQNNHVLELFHSITGQQIDSLIFSLLCWK